MGRQNRKSSNHNSVLMALARLSGSGMRKTLTNPVSEIKNFSLLTHTEIQQVLLEMRNQKSLNIEYVPGSHGTKIATIHLHDCLAKDVAETLKQIHAAELLPKVVHQINKAVIVDYDNIMDSQDRLDYTISFGKLKLHAQGFEGQTLFAEVFLSPDANRQVNINRLWSCGWKVVSCPQRIKDKDSVDSLIKWETVNYLLTPGINKVIVYSDDKDFRDLEDKARNWGKEVVLVGAADIKLHCSGEDGGAEKVVIRRAVLKYVTCLKNLLKEQVPRESYLMKQYELVIETCKLLATKNGYRTRGFHAFSKMMQDKLQFDNVSKQEYENLLRAFIEEKIVFKSQNTTEKNGPEYYHINHRHEIFEIIAKLNKAA